MGFEGHLVSVEVEIRRGLPLTEIIGLPAGEVKESKERVRAAIRRSGYEVPMDRVLINLAPAAVRKRGAAFDLAIAVALLEASGQIDAPLPGALLVMGELRLDGSILPVSGVLAALLCGRNHGVRNVILSKENLREAEFFGNMNLLVLDSLRDLFPPGGVLEFAKIRSIETEVGYRAAGHAQDDVADRDERDGIDYREVRGQLTAKRAVLAAAAGGHHALLLGPPGTGKSMIARRVGAILPALRREQQIEVSAIRSILGRPADGRGIRPPIRAPHHSASLEGIVGGGSAGLPGEISLAHGGALVLDEALEFKSSVLQALREPLESRVVRLVRAEYQIWYPAGFILLLTSNLCPCGGLGGKNHTCSCTASEIRRYWSRLGQAVLDRVEVRAFLDSEGKSEIEELPSKSDPASWSNAEMVKRVTLARERQVLRFAEVSFVSNAEIPPAALDRYCALSSVLTALLTEKCREAKLSYRAEHAVRRVARTLADLGDQERIVEEHLRLALHLRSQGNLEQVLKRS